MMLRDAPLDVLDPSILRPFVARSSFEGLVANALDGVSGVDAGLGGPRTSAAAFDPGALDSAFATTIAPAAADSQAEYDATASSPVPRLVDAGDTADGRRQDSTRYLPQPDFPIDQSFVDPPPAPAGSGVPGSESGESGPPRE